VSPASRTVTSGASVTFTLTTQVTSGNAQPIALAISGLPQDVTATFSPATVTAGDTATLTLTAGATAPSANAVFTVTGTAASGERTATGTLVVASDFSLTLSPAAQTVTAGQGVSYTVTTAVTSGSAETVTLAVTGLPAGITGVFSPASVQAGQTATLTLTADGTAAGGTSPFTVTGTSPSAERTATAQVTVADDFSVSITPSSQTVAAGQSVTYTVTTAVTSGSAGLIGLSIAGLPAGVTAAFNPTSVTAGGTSTLTLTADAGATSATATFTVPGSAGSVSRTAAASITVADDFGISVTPANQTVTSGNSVAYTVSTTAPAGSSQQITLTVSGLPTGITGVFSPATIQAGQTAMLTLTAAASAPGGTTTFTVTGATSLASHSATASITVANDFGLSITPGTQTVAAGSSATFTVTTSHTSGTGEAITLTVSNLPAGVTGVLSPATVQAGQSATLTLTTDTSASGSITFTVTGTAPSATHTDTARLVLSNDFSISVNPRSQTVRGGTTATFTVQTAVTAGVAETVTLTTSDLPPGFTASFNPATVTAGASATLTLTVSTSAAGGTMSFDVIGTASSGTRRAQASVMVSNDFSLRVTPATQTAAGGTATFAIETGLTSGSAETVALTVSGLPAGVTASFSPASVQAGQRATLTLTVAAGTPGGTTAFTVTGTSASATHGAGASLVIANDFSLALSPSTQSIGVGGTATFTVRTEVTSGSAESLTLAIGQLPLGVTASFGTATLQSGGSTTLTLTAATSVTPDIVTVRVTATGTAQHTAEARLTIAAAPTIALKTPQTGSIVSGVVNVTADASAALGTTLLRIDLFIDDKLVTSTTDGTLAYAWNTRDDATHGGHTLRAVATDSLGSTSSSAVTVTVRNPPTVVLTAPAAPISGTATLTATLQLFSGATLTKVELYVGTSTEPIDTETVAPANFTWDTTTVVNGDYTLTAKGYDSAGNVTTSAPVTVKVLNQVDADVGCGCGSTSNSAGVGGLLAMLAVLRGLAGRERRRALAVR
jgi:MYXO-CTERM domain-containing protein